MRPVRTVIGHLSLVIGELGEIGRRLKRRLRNYWTINESPLPLHTVRRKQQILNSQIALLRGYTSRSVVL